MMSGRPILVVWALLIVATATSVALSGGGVSGVRPIVILSVAFVKVDLVGLWFMELRTAPNPLRWAFLAWSTVAWAALTAVYMAGA
jgi:hypothetical protein